MRKSHISGEAAFAEIESDGDVWLTTSHKKGSGS